MQTQDLQHYLRLTGHTQQTDKEDLLATSRSGGSQIRPVVILGHQHGRLSFTYHICIPDSRKKERGRVPHFKDPSWKYHTILLFIITLAVWTITKYRLSVGMLAIKEIHKEVWTLLLVGSGSG